MRTLRVVAPVLIALWVGACCWAAPPGKPTVVVCPEVAQGPRLDGKLDPAEWAAAGLLSDFVTVGTGILPRLPTRVYVLHTSRALFIGAQMYDDKPSELVANVTQRDGPVYEDDCLEIYIDTGGSNEEFAHLVVNSLGTKFDEYGRDVQENFDWNAVAAVNDTGWSVEIELPFENEVPPLEGEV